MWSGKFAASSSTMTNTHTAIHFRAILQEGCNLGWCCLLTPRAVGSFACARTPPSYPAPLSSLLPVDINRLYHASGCGSGAAFLTMSTTLKQYFASTKRRQLVSPPLDSRTGKGGVNVSVSIASKPKTAHVAKAPPVQVPRGPPSPSSRQRKRPRHVAATVAPQPAPSPPQESPSASNIITKTLRASDTSVQSTLRLRVRCVGEILCGCAAARTHDGAWQVRRRLRSPKPAASLSPRLRRSMVDNARSSVTPPSSARRSSQQASAESAAAAAQRFLDRPRKKPRRTGREGGSNLLVKSTDDDVKAFLRMRRTRRTADAARVLAHISGALPSRFATLLCMFRSVDEALCLRSTSWWLHDLSLYVRRKLSRWVRASVSELCPTVSQRSLPVAQRLYVLRPCKARDSLSTSFHNIDQKAARTQAQGSKLLVGLLSCEEQRTRHCGSGT
mgnify:CR=1 FL=1